jgi:carbamoyl-phosphate synthase large subunit
MKSVGEVMAIGRTFKESLFKALRSLEAVRPFRPQIRNRDDLARLLGDPNENRLHLIVHALEQGWTVAELNLLTHVDPWFLDQCLQFAEVQCAIVGRPLAAVSDDTLRIAKQYGFSDRRLAYLTGEVEEAVRARRHAAGIRPVYKRVDTCAAEFESFTPYLYSTYEDEDESDARPGRKIMILGSGPNRIGQGIEFDYCCCHASFALREAGVESIMVNCNPETVSTDYDTSDRLYFEPLTLEDVLEVYERERPDGVIVQFGGQTPLNLTMPLHRAGVHILGTPADSVDLAEDRERFAALLDRLGIAHPEHAIARSLEEARAAAQRLGFPLLVRPSYVLGGRGMAIVYTADELLHYTSQALERAPQGAILIDRYLEDAIELDVDALADGHDCAIAGIMQHIEEAGVHSGDSCCVLPTYKVTEAHLREIREATRAMAKALGVVGLMNVQYAVALGKLYVLEVNPRASRTVPYVAKATGVPLAKVATRLMLGRTLAELGLARDLAVDRYYVKAPVFPFIKFPGVDPRLSPEMRSTGEVMGVAHDFGMAFYKAQLAAGTRLPRGGTAFLTVNHRDKEALIPTARRLAALGFRLVATRGTAAALRGAGLEVEDMLKVSEGRPNGVDALRSGQIHLLINTPLGAAAYRDGWRLRTAAVQHNVPFITTLSGAAAAADAIEALREGAVEVTSLQELHAERGAPMVVDGRR